MSQMPADRGVTSLGLVMQLAGSISGGFMALAAFVMVFAMRDHRHLGSEVLLFGAAITRSVFHRKAGTELLYGKNGLRAVKRYIFVAFAQTVLTTVALSTMTAEGTANGKFILALLPALVVWPAILGGFVLAGRFTNPGVAEDRGYEGASILMTILGVTGAVGSAAFVVMLCKQPDWLFHGPGMLVLLAALMLLARSVMHSQAGLAGLRETSLERTYALANRYANFGVISALSAGGALLLIALATEFDIAGLTAIAGLAFLLICWPLIIRRFFTERRFAELLGEESIVRAPDAGLSALGWLLVGHAALLAMILLPQLAGHIVIFPGKLNAIVFAATSGKPWWLAGLGVLELVAGIALLRMSAHRVIASVYAALATVVTLYVYWPVLRDFGRHEVVVFGIPLMTLQLVLPIATFFLVRRETAPTARARYRAPQPPDTIEK